MNVWRQDYATPLGPMQGASNGAAITALGFGGGATPGAAAPAEALRMLADLGRWLDDYFAGRVEAFAHPLEPVGTSFQREVWQALVGIPYGATASYAQIARLVGRPAAVRAVGAANGRNPIAILVPCHRIIGSNGTLTGYAGGLERKRALLALERRGPFALVA